MSTTNVYGGAVLEAFNRFADFKRMEERMWFLVEAISVKIDTSDNAALQAMCVEALPLWNLYVGFFRRGCQEFGLGPEQSPQTEAMIQMILESGAAGCSVEEIRRLQEPMWAAVDAEPAAERGAEVGQEPRLNVQ